MTRTGGGRSEQRLPRGAFTRKLERICAALDGRDISEAVSKVGPYRFKGIGRVTKLWVAGSYARGALECGDLDLIAEVHRVEGGVPSAAALVPSIAGKLPYVSYYTGTPEKNSSGVSFPEAIEIWSGPGSPWRARLKSIREDPNAGPAPRPADVLPLRPAQLGCTFERLEEIIRLLGEGVLESEFIPFTVPVPNGPIDERLLGNARAARRAAELGQKSRKLVPAVASVLKEREAGCPWRVMGWSRRQEFWCGGSRVEFGAATLPIEGLMEGFQCAQLAVAPHLSSRGPNGVWLLRRGPAHPDAENIRELKAWYFSHDGHPSLVEEVDSRTMILELFTSKAKARRWAPDDELEVALATGNEVLRMTAMADALDLNGNAFVAVRDAGLSYVGKRLGTVPELLKGLGAGQ